MLSIEWTTRQSQDSALSPCLQRVRGVPFEAVHPRGVYRLHPRRGPQLAGREKAKWEGTPTWPQKSEGQMRTPTLNKARVSPRPARETYLILGSSGMGCFLTCNIGCVCVCWYLFWGLVEREAKRDIICWGPLVVQTHPYAHFLSSC